MNANVIRCGGLWVFVVLTATGLASPAGPDLRLVSAVATQDAQERRCARCSTRTSPSTPRAPTAPPRSCGRLTGTTSPPPPACSVPEPTSTPPTITG